MPKRSGGPESRVQRRTVLLAISKRNNEKTWNRLVAGVPV